MSDESPRPDQVQGAPHPRDTPRLIGQAQAEAAFLTAFTSGRLHHAWLISGPRGTGKATLAYRIARFLLATPPQTDDGLFGAPPPPDSLEISDEHPVSQRIRAGAEPGLRVVIRTENEKTGKMRDQIVVDDIRKLGEFFHLSMTDGGHRVVIVDSADDMNVPAANALLKMLEEPPADTTLLLLSHQPSRLLPTIRSRCRTLRTVPLPPADMRDALEQAAAELPDADTALAELSGGSVGDALRLINLSGLEIYAELIALLGTMPRLDRPRAKALADASATRGAEDKLDLLISLLDMALSRLARSGALGQSLPDAAPSEADTFARLAPDTGAARYWAERSADITARLRHGRAVNLDPAALVLDTLLKLNDTARAVADRTVA
ncbi:DNA polymerase III subunit delta' [Aliishimia ponticola]|uniref:DNA polymerase III subunit delta n=1 Tax=Aliishimia ponticola TaxID=2499833 RepID=A0A4S4ND76_9RHOB|nr:DNA polymerase III subunit delta' [Aliishimia ponticola]THH37434.1 DNA polymerase III subunit delta' [Aliishimia ponticola]